MTILKPAPHKPLDAKTRARAYQPGTAECTQMERACARKGKTWPPAP